MTARQALRLLAAVTLAFAVGLTAAKIADAETNGVPQQPNHTLRTHGWAWAVASNQTTRDDAAVVIRWRDVPHDSPVDADNTRALRVAIPQPTVNLRFSATAATAAGRRLDRPVQNVQNLSFDFSQMRRLDFSAPRITVELSDGTVAYLAALYCQRTLGSDPSWGRADFTGRVSEGCEFYDSDGLTWASDGTRSAWQAFTDAHPTLNVTAAYMEFDQPGHYLVDRIAFGTNRLYNYGTQRAVSCHSQERAC